MKKIKILIILICIIILILIIALICLSLKHKKEEKKHLSVQGDKEVAGIRNVYKVDSKSIIYSIDNCIKKYLSNIDNNLNTALYNILDKEYIQKNNIKIDNVIESVNYFANKKYTIKEIYYLDARSQIPYIVSGQLYDNNNIENKYFIVIFDVRNETFSIKEVDEEIYNQYKNGLIYYTESSIEKNDYNELSNSILSDEDLIKSIFYDYIENVVYFPTYAYKTLNNEYSKKRFKDYEEYKSYLKNNIDNFRLIEMNRAKKSTDFESQEEYSKYFSEKYFAGLRKYQVNKNAELSQYICIDGNGNYYIFNLYEDFSYDVILDTYTIELQQFIQKYNNSNIQEKVALNIDKFFKAINDMNYRFAYSCLADGFKKNKFQSQSNFEDFIKNNLFNKNNIEYKSFKNEGETYIYNIVVKNANKESEKKNIQIIMKLNEATDFVMSFNIK